MMASVGDTKVQISFDQESKRLLRRMTEALEAANKLKESFPDVDQSNEEVPSNTFDLRNWLFDLPVRSIISGSEYDDKVYQKMGPNEWYAVGSTTQWNENGLIDRGPFTLVRRGEY